MSVGQFESQGANERRDFRCPVENRQQVAVLKIAGTEHAVGLLDESAGGFAVRATERLGVNVDDVAELRTQDGAFEVRVAHVSEEPPPPRDPLLLGQEEPEEEPTPSYRIGLQRLKELGIWEEGTRRRRRFRALWFRPSNYLPSNRSLPLVGVGLAVTCVVAPMLFLKTLGHHGNPIAEPLGAAGSALGHLAPKKPPTRVPDWISALDAREGSGGTPSRAPASRGRASSSPLSAAGAKLGQTIRRLSGATPFELPEVIRELSLTETQQGEIHRIIDSCGRALREIDTFAPGTTRLERSRKRGQILAAARREAVSLLTPEQQIRWSELEEASKPAPSS